MSALKGGEEVPAKPKVKSPKSPKTPGKASKPKKEKKSKVDEAFGGSGEGTATPADGAKSPAEGGGAGAKKVKKKKKGVMSDLSGQGVIASPTAVPGEKADDISLQVRGGPPG